MWRASVLTIFPEMFPGPLAVSLCGKALATGLWSLQIVDIRDFASDKHRSVDDTPAGGGPGMVMRADVLARAIDAAAVDEEGRGAADVEFLAVGETSIHLGGGLRAAHAGFDNQLPSREWS